MLMHISRNSGVVSLPHIPGVSSDGSGDGRSLVGSSSKRPHSDGRRKEKRKTTGKVSKLCCCAVVHCNDNWFLAGYTEKLSVST